MHYTIYKVTNLINGKFYIGSHKTKDLNDKYMGSGKYLKHAQEKYGIENFKKEILFVFDTAEEMYAKEAEIVNADFLAEENTYNLKVGGFGGFSYINSLGRNKNFDFTNYKNREAVMKGYSAGIGAEGFVPPKFKGNEFAGKRHTAEAKQKIGSKNSAHQTGKGNSQFGSMWVTNGQENLKIKKTDTIPEGYRKGRVVKRQQPT